MWIVKLGGSLLGSPELKAWLEMLVRQSDGRIIIVPGGGIFADAVREAQRIAAFNDAAAHHMALLAMEQYGFTLKSLQPKLVTAASELEISERSWQHRAIVWMPSKMVLADETIPQNWSVTSDSLAAWLAGKVNASRLVLVKQAQIADSEAPLEQLVKASILDQAFVEFAAGLSCRIHVVNKSGHAEFARVLAGGPLPTRAF